MKKRILIIAIIAAIATLCTVAVLIHQRYPLVKNTKNYGNKSSTVSASQEWVDMTNTITGNEENELKQALAVKPVDQYIGRSRNGEGVRYQLFISFHKANDNYFSYFNHYGDDDCYKVYYLQVITNWFEQMKYKEKPTEQWVLRMRNIDKLYQIDISPTQQREILQKLLDINYFDLDNPVPESWFMHQYRYRGPFAPEGVVDYDLTLVDFIGITLIDYSVWDGTPKNKAAIDSFTTWLEGKYQAELLKNPVEEWTDDPTGKYDHPAEGW